jgi:hypothetical protein
MTWCWPRKERWDFRSSVSAWKTMDWGGKGGKGGGQLGRTKNGFGTTPYFLVIANDQEGWEAFSSVIILSRFLDRLLTICEAQKIVLYLTRNKKLSRQFLLSWFGFEIEELPHNHPNTSFPPTHNIYTIIHYYTLLYTIILLYTNTSDFWTLLGH